MKFAKITYPMNSELTEKFTHVTFYSNKTALTHNS